jgi:hypothetical protein
MLLEAKHLLIVSVCSISHNVLKSSVTEAKDRHSVDDSDIKLFITLTPLLMNVVIIANSSGRSDGGSDLIGPTQYESQIFLHNSSTNYLVSLSLPYPEFSYIRKQLGSECDAEKLVVSFGSKLFDTRPNVLPKVEGVCYG